MSRARIQLDLKAVAKFCRQNHIRKLSLFGSVLRDDFGPQSDVDVLVEFNSDWTPSLLAMARMERELSELVGRQVDLRTAEDLSHYFRDEVVAGAELQYAAA
jgi:uncharacterized protein